MSYNFSIYLIAFFASSELWSLPRNLSSLSLNEGYDFPTNLKEQDPVLVSVLTARGGTLDFEDEIAEDEEEGTEEGTEETTEGADEKPAEDNSSEDSGEKSE